MRDSSEGYLRVPILTNEYGIVIPPPISECIGEECAFRGDSIECEQDAHHLHSTEPFYSEASRKAYKFRDIESLRVYLPRCQHKIHHDQHELNVAVPDLEIMRAGMRDHRKLKKTVSNLKELGATEKALSQPDISLRAFNGLMSKREVLLEEGEELFARVLHIEVLPEELVIGALLIVRPDYARKKIIEGADVVLTGVISREDVPLAKQRALRALAKAKALQSEVDAVELAA